MEKPTPEHRRPDGVSDETVEALGKLSEALEVVEDARGSLYAFHRMTGMADATLGEAVEALRTAGHDALADELTETSSGRNVVEGRWTFQLVEEYDDGYYATFKRLEQRARDRARRRSPPPLRGGDEGGRAQPRTPSPRGRSPTTARSRAPQRPRPETG